MIDPTPDGSVLLSNMSGGLLSSAFTSGVRLYNKLMGSIGISPSTGTLVVTDTRTDRSYRIPIKNNAIKAVDLAQITSHDLTDGGADTGLRVLDKGFANTACTETSITHIDGKLGHMQYRNKSIEELFRNNDYEETIHLLIFGALPTAPEKTHFRRMLAHNMQAPQQVRDAISAFPRDGLTHPMLLAGLAAFASLDEGTRDLHHSGRAVYPGNMPAVDLAIGRTLAALATTVALVYCHKRGRDFTPPDADGSYVGNILRMMGVLDGPSRGRKLERCLERLWVLNADHGMTNSTAVFLAAASTLQDPLSCTVAAVAAAYGPLHGGAMEVAYREFERVGSVGNVPRLIEEVKAKKYRLSGYGHRIYKVTDPRSRLTRQLIEEYREDVERNDLLKVALEIDRVAEEDPYFTSRNLKANADLYGCFLYTALGLEEDIILALACVSRLPGVLAHWRESMNEPPRLWRPQHIFTGTVVARPT